MFMRLLPLLVFFWLLPGHAYSQQAKAPERTDVEVNDFVCFNENSLTETYFAEPHKLLKRVAAGVSPETVGGCCQCGPRGCRNNMPPGCQCCECHVPDVCFKAFDAKEGTATYTTKDGKTHQLAVTRESFDLFKGLNTDDCGRLDVSPELKATGFERGK